MLLSYRFSLMYANKAVLVLKSSQVQRCVETNTPCKKYPMILSLKYSVFLCRYYTVKLLAIFMLAHCWWFMCLRFRQACRCVGCARQVYDSIFHNIPANMLRKSKRLKGRGRFTEICEKAEKVMDAITDYSSLKKKGWTTKWDCVVNLRNISKM